MIQDKVRVIGLENDRELEDVEVVIGVGILAELGKKGYRGLKAEEIFKDIVLNNGKFDYNFVVEESLPEILVYHHSMPMYKYLQNEFLTKQQQKAVKNKSLSEKSIMELRTKYSILECLKYISKLHRDFIDIKDLEMYLVQLYNEYPIYLKMAKLMKKRNSEGS